MSLFDTVSDNDIIEELRNVDVGNLTPIEALNKLYELQNKVKIVGKNRQNVRKHGNNYNFTGNNQKSDYVNGTACGCLLGR